MQKKIYIIFLFFLLFCRLPTLLAQDELQKQAEEQRGFLLDIPQITNPDFQWGLRRSGAAIPWWSNATGINFREFELVFFKGQGIENFRVSQEDESIFTTEKGKKIVKIQIGLVGFGNKTKSKPTEKKQRMILEFMAEPSSSLQKRQPLTNILIDAIKNNKNIEVSDLNNIYVICDQSSDLNDVLGYEQARCLIWYRSTGQLIPRKVIEQKQQPILPKNYHYYYVQLEANTVAFNERQALVKDLYAVFDSIKSRPDALYHLYIANGTRLITVEPDEVYGATLDKLLEFYADPPSLEAHRDRIWQDIGGEYKESYMQKLSQQQQANGDLRYGNVYFHYYLSEQITDATDINTLICSMFDEKDKTLKNMKIYIYKKENGKYEPCLLDYVTCNHLDYRCD